MGAILLLERTAAAASPTGIKNVVLVHAAFADGSGWEDGRSCVFLVLGVGTGVLHDISSMLTCRTLLIRSHSSSRQLTVGRQTVFQRLLERNEWRQLIWQADQFAIRRQTIC